MDTSVLIAQSPPTTVCFALQPHQHVIAKRPDSGAASQPRIKMLTELEEVRMPPGPGFKVTGGHSDSNALDRFHSKFGSKRPRKKSHGRITDMDECSVGDAGAAPLWLEATERLFSVPLRQIPSRFPHTAGTDPAEHHRRTRLEQSGETACYLLEVIDTIQCAKV